MSKNLSPPESWEQEQVIKWKRANQVKIPALKLLHVSLAGARISKGLRSKLKRQGMEAGIPDIMLDVPSRGYHGLRIELKRVKGGVISEDQKQFIKLLNDQGYYAQVCRGHVEAINLIKKYLGG